MKAFKPLTKRRQRGAFTILGGASILLALSALVLVVDTGRLYFEQRNLQKVANMAALESVGRLEKGICYLEKSDAQGFAEDNARRNDFLSDSKQTIKTACVNITSPSGIRVVNTSEYGQAVQVTASHTIPTSLIVQAGSLFSSKLKPTSTLSASATAQRQEPSASFSVGAELLRLDNDRLLGVLLKTIGLNVDNLSVLNSQGLIDAKVTPSGLLRLLGIKVGIDELRLLSPEGLLELTETQVGLLGIDRLVDISLDLVTDPILRAELEALRLQVLNNDILRNIKLDLFKVPGLTNEDGTPKISRGIISLHAGEDGTVGSALDANINLGPLLKTSLLIGSAGRGVQVKDLTVLGGAAVELGIVEPPSLAAGPVGTTAYNAQVRIYIHADTSKLLGGFLKPLLEWFLGTRVNLPITIDVVSGYATLDKINCSLEEPTVDISVTSHILNTCVGKMPEEHKWSGSKSCDHYVQEDELIRLLHIPILSGSTYIPALTQFDNKSIINRAVGGPYTTDPNNLNLGDSVDQIVTGLLNLLSGVFREPSPVGFNIDKLDPNSLSEEQRAGFLAKEYVKLTRDENFYNVDNASKLVVEGGTYETKDGQPFTLPPLDTSDPDWFIPKGIPVTCLLAACPPSAWKPGTFSSSFNAYSNIPYGILDMVGVPTLGNGYISCAGLLTAGLARNSCIEHNLRTLFLNKPGGPVMSGTDVDLNSLSNLNSDDVTCGGALCVMLKPLLNILKPLLNSIGRLLKVLLSSVLGLELGRTDIEVHEISCGTARLVN